VYNAPLADASLVACPECDLLQRLPDLESGASARCPRCSFELWRRRDHISPLTLPLTLTAVVLYVIANTTPMLGLEAVGRTAFTTVLGGAEHLWRDGREIVSVLVLFTAMIAPALQIGFMLAIVLGGRAASPPPWVRTLLRFYPSTLTWSMIEVMMLGVLVALIKIAELASVIPGIALYTLGVLIVLLAAIQASFDPHEAWLRVTWVEREERVQAAAATRPSGVTPRVSPL
jgi:paraquat-inducible protein A